MNKRHGWRVFRFTHLFLVAAVLLSSLSPALASDFCSRTKEDLLQAFQQSETRMGFKNDGGLGNGGVCWWHSRLQRSSLYLATYAPEKAKPSSAEAMKILRRLTFFTQVVEIPGYSNFSDFSKDYQSVVQKELNHWQMRDGFINQQWIRGISGHWSAPAKELQTRMDHIFDSFTKSPAGIWVMVQLKGITSHALLVIGMQPAANGYELKVIDSNYPDVTHVLQYHEGDQFLRLGDQDDERFTPYLGFQNDFKKISDALARHCGSN